MYMDLNSFYFNPQTSINHVKLNNLLLQWGENHIDNILLKIECWDLIDNICIHFSSGHILNQMEVDIYYIRSIIYIYIYFPHILDNIILLPHIFTSKTNHLKNIFANTMWECCWPLYKIFSLLPCKDNSIIARIILLFQNILTHSCKGHPKRGNDLREKNHKIRKKKMYALYNINSGIIIIFIVKSNNLNMNNDYCTRTFAFIKTYFYYKFRKTLDLH